MTLLIVLIVCVLVVVVATATAWMWRRPNRAGIDVDRFNVARAMTTSWAQNHTSLPVESAGDEQ
jgi:hypothetical protein